MTAAALPEEVTPQRRPYRPYGKALDLMRCRADEVLLSGPAGTGKSRACLEKLHLCAEKYPGMRGLILRKTRESLTESALVTWESAVVPEGHPCLAGAARAQRKVYPYPNGSSVVVGGLRASGKDMTQKVMSTEYDLVYVQEAIELQEEEWEKATTRLRNGKMPYQQLLADTNPDRPRHWLKRRCDAGKTLLLESRHEDNPVLWGGKEWTEAGKKYLAKLDALTGPRKLRLRHGRWVQAEGVVYPGWDPAVHLIDPFPIPADWRRFRSIDFGFTNPFVCGWWAIDPDGRLYRYREIYRTRRTVRAHAETINRLSGGEAIEATVSDHDAEDRATLHECGIGTLPANKAVTVGIQAVGARLAKAGDGRPRLFVFRGCLVEPDEDLVEAKKPYCCEHEFDGYHWPEDAAGKAVKEEPVKVDDHAMDELRYAVMYADGGAAYEFGVPAARQDRSVFERTPGGVFGDDRDEDDRPAWGGGIDWEGMGR